MTQRSWWGLALLWILAVIYGWTLYFEQRSAQEIQQRKMAEWRAVFDSVNSPMDSPKPEYSLSIDSHRLREDVSALSFPRFTPDERKAARKFISHRLADLGYGQGQHAFRDGINVFADRPGTDPAKGHLIVAAHYDTVEGSPGADDNATGVAVTLELARLFAQQPTPMGIRFVFFDAEENQLKGSTAYSMDQERLKTLKGVFVLEMLGTTCSSPGCQTWPEETPEWMRTSEDNFVAVIGLLEKTTLIRSVVNAQRPGLPPVLGIPVPEKGIHWPNSRRSDHAVFWDREIEAVMLTDTANFRNPRYHTTEDTPEHIDWTYLAGTAEIAYRAIRAVADPDMVNP